MYPYNILRLISQIVTGLSVILLFVSIFSNSINLAWASALLFVVGVCIEDIPDMVQWLKEKKNGGEKNE